MKKLSTIFTFLGLFSFFSWTHAQEPLPNINLEKFVDIVVEKLIEVPETNAEEIVDLCAILTTINGSYIKETVTKSLPRLTGSKDLFIKTALLPVLNEKKEPNFSLEKLLSHQRLGLYIKELISKIPALQKEKMLTLIVTYHYCFELSATPMTKDYDEEINSYNLDMASKKLPGKRGNILTRRFKDTHQERFEEVSKKLMELVKNTFITPPQVLPPMRILPKLLTNHKHFEVQAPIAIEINLPKNDKNFFGREAADFCKTSPFFQYLTLELKKFEEKDEDDKDNWTRIEVDVKEAPRKEEKNPLPTEQHLKEYLNEEQRAALETLRSSTKWEEQWAALENLSNAPMFPEIKSELIKIISSSTELEVKNKAATLLVRDPKMLSNDPKIIEVLKSLPSDQFFGVFLSGIDKLDTTTLKLMLQRLDPKADLKYRHLLLKRYVEQNPSISEEGFSIIVMSLLDIPYPCANEADENAVITASIKAILDVSASEKNYYLLLPLKTHGYWEIRQFVAQKFSQFGRKKDLVHILPLIKDTDQDVRKEALKAIEQMKTR